ncbi:SDR family oxidoreductase [Christensenellaceae bacterium OttesenSCG-928-M15]|nr:SDR family oxidoreductase [Christensenellaceae bacterium OttesenSCG-928-M15]
MKDGNAKDRVILIVGASSGIGLEAARLFAREGYIVYGASRRGCPLAVPGAKGALHALVMDVSNEQSIKNGVQAAIKEQGHIDILLYAAGNGLSGPAELASKEHAQAQLDVNFYGALSLINAVTPHMRERRSGLLLFVGSVGGIFPVPYQLLYSASKAALSIYVEGLRLELKPFCVHACIVEPGDVKTAFTDARRPIGCIPPYEEAMNRAVSRMERDERNGMSPSIVAKALLRAAKRKSPPARMTVGAQYRFFVGLKRVLPRRLVEWLLYKMYLG